MSGLDAGFIYPDLVRDSIRLVLDSPAPVEIRVDPEGERKAEERMRSRQEWAERNRIIGTQDVPPEMIRRRPPTKTIHLQWLDTSYDPVWRDADLHIDLEKKRLYNDGGGIPFFSRGHSESFGWIFALPVLVVLTPYLYVRARRYRAQERKHAMSRHAIVLMERLKGQLDAKTESLLREALRNEWTHHRKLTRRVNLEEARAALTECEMLVSRFGRPDERPCGEVRYWRDADGDVIASCEREDGSPNPTVLRVLGTRFRDADAEALLEVCLHRTDDTGSLDA